MNDNNWPFDDPLNVAVFTVRSILKQGKPILYVSHDEDDGAWQFHTGREPKEEESSIVALKSIVKIDESIKELADLPYGWCAWRESVNDPWKREKIN